ncbi:hypothetical protein KCU73_g95, partial [Aureobasidium melanogenum]
MTGIALPSRRVTTDPSGSAYTKFRLVSLDQKNSFAMEDTEAQRESMFFSMLILLQRETHIYYPENLQNLDQATPSASVTNPPGIQVVASILGIFYLQQALSVLSLSYL